jgi:hypothetical protein
MTASELVVIGFIAGFVWVLRQLVLAVRRGILRDTMSLVGESLLLGSNGVKTNRKR